METKKKFKAAIFDLDGLMLDTESVSHQAWKRAMADFGYTLEDDLYHKIIGRVIDDIQVIFAEVYGSDFPLKKIYKQRFHYVDEYIEKCGIKIKPGLLEVLDLLDAAKLPKAVATSSPAKCAMRKLAAAGLAERFQVILCGDNVPNGKPAPDIFLMTADKLKVSADACLVFEDSENGLIASHNAGMTTILVPDSKQPSPDIAELAFKIFPSLSDAAVFLKKILNVEK